VDFSEFTEDGPELWAALEAETGIGPDHPKWGRLHWFAWQHGHAGGVSDVIDWFLEGAELIK
jgi:hypothetical protein